MLLQSLLASPIPDDPEDPIVARQCIEKPEVFKLTAQHWAHAYAGGNLNHVSLNEFLTLILLKLGPFGNSDYENKIRELTNVGWTEMNARMSLSSCDWDLQQIPLQTSPSNQCAKKCKLI